jgi:hypothetical protein
MTLREFGLPVMYVLLVGALSWQAGCQGTDLGRFCVVGAEPSIAEEKLNSKAPECEERLCLAQRGYRCADDDTSCDTAPERQLPLKPMCTVPCSRNADCKGGDTNINGCTHYVCQNPVWGSEYDGCYCVCLDFVRSSTGDPMDKAAFNASDQACGN